MKNIIGILVLPFVMILIIAGLILLQIQVLVNIFKAKRGNINDQ